MILYLNTIKNNGSCIELKVINGDKIVVSKEFKIIKQSEKLLAIIKEFLESNNINLDQIKKIKVENFGGSFSSLRMGVVVANALAFALNIKVEGIRNIKSAKISNIDFNIVEPIYNRDANITTSHKKIL